MANNTESTKNTGMKPYEFISTERLAQIMYNTKGNKRYCFILGAGASVESKIRMGRELGFVWTEELEREYLARNTNLDTLADTAEDLKRKGIPIENDVNSIIAAYKDAKSKDEKVMPSKYYFDIYALRYYDTGYEEGFQFLEDEMEKAEPSIGYHPLALMLADNTLGNNLVITTNFDNLTEEALYIYKNKHPIVINHESMAGFAEGNIRNRPIIAKVHRGVYYKPLNTSDETKGLMGDWEKVLEKLFETFTPIVIGYAGGDGSLMSLLEKSEKLEQIYWCFLEGKETPDEGVRKLINKRPDRSFVGIAGFDALMLTIGIKFFKDQIDPLKIENYLKQQADKRSKRYTELYTELRGTKKEIDESPRPTGSEKDFAHTIASILDAVMESINAREAEGTLTAWDYCFKGERALDEGKYDDAINFYSEAIALKPDDAEAYNNRGNAYYAKGDHDQAISDYNKAIELKPDLAEAYANRGTAYYAKGDHDQAIADFNKAITLKPDLAEAYYNRGTAYALKGNYDQAISDYSKAIALKPDYAEAYSNRGNAYGANGEYDQAIADFNKAIELKPDFAAAYYNRGNAYDAKGDHDQAISDYNKAIALKPDDAKAYNNRGNAYDDKGEYDLAIADFNKAIALKPDDAAAYYNRGNAYGKKGDNDLAIANYNKAIALKPDYAAAYSNRGNAYKNKGDHDPAIADYNKAIELNPDFAGAYSNRGLAYDDIGEYDKAIADCNKAIELEPDFAYAYINRGAAYSLKGEHDKAITDYGKTIELMPDLAEAYAVRGIAYKMKGEHDKAVADYSKAIELKPDFAKAYNNSGNAYYEKGEYDKAIADFIKASDLDPALAKRLLQYI